MGGSGVSDLLVPGLRFKAFLMYLRLLSFVLRRSQELGAIVCYDAV